MQANAKREKSSLKDILAFQCADLDDIVFPKSTFDALLCSAALVFLPNIPSTLATWHRWLKPGTGRVVFNTPKRHASAAFSLFASEGIHHGAGKIEDPSAIFSTEQDVLTVLQGAGFSSVEVRTTVEGRDCPGISPEEWARTLWPVCSKSPFSPVEKIVSQEAAEAWKESFIKKAVEYAHSELIDKDDGVIRDSHEMFWVVGKV